MVPEIISFSKSMSTRLQEYANLLSEVETPCSEIQAVWGLIFQDLVAPISRWQALWILSEENCIKYDLLYPTAVIVTVEGLNWNELSATVSVVAVQDGIVLPSSLDVPIIELHPIKDQEYDKKDLNVMADWLDKCRYFFKYLWYPWDAEIKVNLSEWCYSHLENRLQIQYDIHNGMFKKNVVHYYRSLLKEARKVNAAINDLNSEGLSKNPKMDVINNFLRMGVLKTELEFFEEPDLRNDFIMLREKQQGSIFGRTSKEAKVIWGGGNIESLIKYLGVARGNTESDAIVKVSPSLQEALDDSCTGDTIFLPPGSYYLKSLVGLGSGGSIIGLDKDNVEETKIYAHHFGLKRTILFESFGNFELENVTVSRKEGIIVQVFEKTMKISNCRFLSDRSPTRRGIIVLSGCELIMENCQIVGFGIGIALEKGSKASITNTKISECFGGLKMSDASFVSLKDVEVSNCSEYGIRLESSRVDSDLPICGDLDLIDSEDGKFNFQNVVLGGNAKCNVVIEKKSNFAAWDSFDADLSSDTIVITEEEEEDEEEEEEGGEDDDDGDDDDDDDDDNGDDGDDDDGGGGGGGGGDDHADDGACSEKSVTKPYT